MRKSALAGSAAPSRGHHPYEPPANFPRQRRHSIYSPYSIKLARIAPEMPGYYDSSFLLTSLLDQPGRDQLVACWDDEPIRVSSILLEAECLTVLRRAAASQPAPVAPTFLALRLRLLKQYLAGVTLKDHDNEVNHCLRNEPRLGSCRTLDAIHLATALLFQEQFESPLTICSLDNQLRAVAVVLGFPVAP